MEVLITVALLSIAFVGILSAVGGLVVSGAENRNATTVQAAVKNVAVFTQSFGSAPYFGCSQSPTALYQNDIDTRLTLPAGVTATVTNVQFWDGNTPAQFLAACPTIAPNYPGAHAGDQGLEVVTVTVSSSPGLGGVFSQSLTVLKRSAA